MSLCAVFNIVSKQKIGFQNWKKCFLNRQLDLEKSINVRQQSSLPAKYVRSLSSGQTVVRIKHLPNVNLGNGFINLSRNYSRTNQDKEKLKNIIFFSILFGFVFMAFTSYQIINQPEDHVYIKPDTK